MSLIPFTVTVIDHVNNPNNTLANTAIEIRTTQAGEPLAQIYSDEAGLIPIPQPGAQTNDLGVFYFYAESEGDFDYKAISSGFSENISGSSHNKTTNRNAVGAHDEIYRRAATVAQTENGDFQVGSRLTVTDRGDAHFDVVAGSGANGYNILDAGSGKVAISSGALEFDRCGVGLGFSQQINNNRRDVNLLVQGDSTGNETYEWVYLTALNLVSEYPTHTVNYYLWNHASGDYDPVQVLGTGSGVFAINIYNGSVSGSSAVYFDGSRKENCYAGKSFDLIIQNYGHNGATAAGVNEVAMRTMQHTVQLIQDQPSSEVVLTLQNIDTSVPDYSARQVQATLLVADLLGLPTIDIRSVFSWAESKGILPSWMGDSVHPNVTGQGVWAEIVWRALTSGAKQGSHQRNVLNEKVTPKLDNSQFSSWTWSDPLPSGWDVANATVTKELSTNETGKWSVKCVGASASTGVFVQNYNNFLLERTQGVDCTFMARVYTPSSNGSINAGRVDVTTNLGSISVDPYPEVFDGWTWMLVTVPSSLLDGASTFRAGLFTGDNTDELYIDRVSLVEGRTPYDSSFKTAVLSDYYDPSNALSYGSNVISVVDDSVTIVSTSEAFPSWYLNVYGLVANESYTMTWTATSGSGTVLARAELGDAGTVLASVSPLNSNTITWRPTKSTGSLQISNSAGTEPFTLDNIKIVKG